MRILIIRLSSIGDVICALPTLRALRERFPQAHIAWLVDAACREILEGCDALDEIYVNPMPSGKTMRWGDALRVRQLWRGARALTRTLREQRFDVAIDLHGYFRTAVWCQLARAPLRIGLLDNVHEFNHLFVNRRVPSMGKHIVERMLGAAAALGADVSQPRFGYQPPVTAQAFAEQFLAERGFTNRRSLIGINAGASRRINRWQPERLAAVADRLADETGSAVILFGSAGDAPMAQTIVDHAKRPLLVATGRTTLSQLAALLARCHLLISGDTGPMHLAAAVSTPVVAIFGPADPSLTGPYGKQHVIVEKYLPCRPCFKKPRACRGRIDCLKMVEVDDVVSAALRVLALAKPLLPTPNPEPRTRNAHPHPQT